MIIKLKDLLLEDYSGYEDYEEGDRDPSGSLYEPRTRFEGTDIESDEWKRWQDDKAASNSVWKKAKAERDKNNPKKLSNHDKKKVKPTTSSRPKRSRHKKEN